MKNIKELTNSTIDKLHCNPTSRTSINTTSTKTIIFPEWLAKLFTIFAVNYKNLWIESQHNEQMRLATKILWSNSFKDCQAEVILKAAEQAIKIHKFPPSIAEFTEIIAGLLRNNKYDIEMKERERNKLLEKKPDKEIGKKYMIEIMKKLGRKPHNET